MDDELSRLFDNEPYRHIEAHGPFLREDYTLTVHGYEVPHIRAILRRGTEDTWSLICDGRFIMDCPGEEMRRWLWFLANAMAVAAGYSCHGEHCQPINPFMVQVHGIDSIEVDREGL